MKMENKTISVVRIEKISRYDIQELKILKAPPQAAKELMEAVNILFGVAPGWKNSTQLMNNIKKFVDMLNTFDKDSIEKSKLEKIKPYIDNPSLAPEKIANVNKSCVGLAEWVRAVYFYANGE